MTPLEPLRSEKSREVLKDTTYLLIGWTIWLCIVSTLPLPFSISIPGTAFVILFGAFRWSILQAMGFLLAVAWIYRGISITPPGFYWLSAFPVFVIMRTASLRFDIRSPIHCGIAVGLASLGLESLQLLFMGQVWQGDVLSWKILFSILLSSLLQGLVGLVLARPYVALIESK